MKFLEITKYNIRVLLRELKLSGIMIILPVLFMGVFGFAFGSQNVNQETYTVGFLFSGDDMFDQSYRTALDDFEIEGVDVVELVTLDSYEEAQAQLLDNQIDVFLEYNNDDQQIVMHTDYARATPYSAGVIIENFTYGFLGINTDGFAIDDIGQEATGAETPFDMLVPGLIIYGMLMLIAGISINYTSINESGQILRYFMSKTKAIDIIGANIVTYLIIGFFQTIILVITALVVGFNNQVDLFKPTEILSTDMFVFLPTQALLLTILVTSLTVIFMVALGLIVGAFTTKVDTASNISTMIMIVLGFLSGAFLGNVGELLTVTIGDWSYSLANLLPTYIATEAIKSIVVFGEGFSYIQNDLLVILVVNVALLIVGAYIFKRRRLMI